MSCSLLLYNILLRSFVPPTGIPKKKWSLAPGLSTFSKIRHISRFVFMHIENSDKLWIETNKEGIETNFFFFFWRTRYHFPEKNSQFICSPVCYFELKTFGSHVGKSFLVPSE